MKTFIKTLLVAVTILFSVFATAKQVKLPNNIKYVIDWPPESPDNQYHLFK